MSTINWDNVDLSEWIGMLNVAGELPDPTQMNIEALTGNGSAMDMTEEDRPNVIDRTGERMTDLDYQAIINSAKTGAAGAVPSTPIP
jgi:conjugal transfer mating pair stabilization protein TraN